jgi:hypothetical protein
LLTWRFWRVIFSDGFKKTARTAIAVYIADGFEMADLCGDVSIVTSESSTVSPMDIPSVKSSIKGNICPPTLSSPISPSSS